MDIEQLISDFKSKHYQQIKQSLQVVISPSNTANSNLNLKPDRELRAEVQQQQLEEISSDLDRALKALKWAKQMADIAKLSESHSSCYTALSDALTNTQEAIERLNDAPDQ